MIKRNRDTFIEKLSSVHDFKSLYLEEGCLVEASILELEDDSIKKYALVRVFIDQKNKKEQAYVIFINDKEAITFIDLVSGLSKEEIIRKHLAFSPEQSVYKVGLLQASETIILQEEDSLVASLLWAVETKTNLEPETGFMVVKKFLSPTF